MNTFISVCVATYQRPEGLRRLLDGIAAQTCCSGVAPGVRVIVVDNDAAGSARSVCEAVRNGYPVALHYHHEPRRGITFARNAAVALALPDSTFLAFIDDDEVPAPGWLDELMAVQQRYQAEVVTGPVLPHFPTEVPRWVIAGGYFDRPRFLTGTPRPAAATNNVLVSARLFQGVDEPFDNRFALTGGSDYHFFEGAARAGHRIVWADEAVVHEWVPASRATMRWLALRQFRISISHVQRELEFQDSSSVRITRLARGVARSLQGAVLLPVGALASPSDGGVRLVGALRVLAHGVGSIAGLLGWKYEEYRRVHRV